MSTSPETTSAAGSLGSELAAFVSKLSPETMRDRSTQIQLPDGRGGVITYTSTKFSARKGLAILPRVGALLGAALGPIMNAKAGEEFDVRVFEDVADRAMRDGLGPLCLELLSDMACDKILGQESNPGNVGKNFDEHFAGEYLDLLKVLIFALFHNFRGFARGSL